MNNTRGRALAMGGIIGLLIGCLAGWIYFNTNVEVDSEGSEILGAPSPATAVKLGLGLLGVLRLISG
jgi:hypothetical protein